MPLGSLPSMAATRDPHLPRRLVGEGHRQDAIRRHSVLQNEATHPRGEHPGLPGSGTRKHQAGPLEVLDRLALLGVQEDA